jgi:hypothetical protein
VPAMRMTVPMMISASQRGFLNHGLGVPTDILEKVY